jgi:hypothetical protein
MLPYFGGLVLNRRHVMNAGGSLSCTRLNRHQFLGNTKVFTLKNLDNTKKPRSAAFLAKSQNK